MAYVKLATLPKAAAWWRRPHRQLRGLVPQRVDTAHCAIAPFLAAFAKSGLFPAPPDVLPIALVLGVRQRPWR